MPTCRTKLEYLEGKDQTNDALGPVGIFWDIDNCPIPTGVAPKDIRCNVQKALSGGVTKFRAFGNFNAYPSTVRKDLKSTGVNIDDVPHEGKKYAADMAILVDMFLYALDNLTPSTIVLISDDKDFSAALHELNRRRYNILIAIPSHVHVSPDLISAGKFVWDWPSLARGKVVGTSRPLASAEDLEVLKGEMRQLLQSTEMRSLHISQIPGEYQKLFLRPLICKHYGATKLRELCQMLGDSFNIVGRPGRRILSYYTDPALEGEAEKRGNSLEHLHKVTDMTELQENLAGKSKLHVESHTTVPISVTNIVECVSTEDLQAPTKVFLELVDDLSCESRQLEDSDYVDKVTDMKENQASKSKLQVQSHTTGASASESVPKKMLTCGTKLDYLKDNDKMNDALGPVGIFWDIENCPVPTGAAPKDIFCNVRKALSGGVTKFCAFGDFSFYPSRVREDLESTGVGVVDVPHEGKKDAADKAILVDMFLYALDNLTPSTIVLISGDKDFAAALYELNRRRYNILIAIPSGVHVSPDLISAGNLVWDWPSLARGKVVETSRPLASVEDIEVLKVEMRQLLESTEMQSLHLSQIPGEYQKLFLRPLICKHYGASELRELCKMLGDSFNIIGGLGKGNLCLYTDPALEGEAEKPSNSLKHLHKVTDMTELQEDLAGKSKLHVESHTTGEAEKQGKSLEQLHQVTDMTELQEDLAGKSKLHVESHTTVAPGCDGPSLPGTGRSRRRRRHGRRRKS